MKKVESKWFVIYNHPTLDGGVKDFEWGEQAAKFKEALEEAGYTWQVFFGELSGMFHSEGKHATTCQCNLCLAS